MDKVYDIIIIGGGPAGLAAAIYAGRAKLSCLVLEAENEGGQIISTSEIENYPGCQADESGQSLVSRMLQQAEHFGAEFARDQVISVDLNSQPKLVAGFAKDHYAKAVIIATGAKPARIGCPGEEEFTGLGVSYCATCDAAFFEGLPVYVVGGGDAAVEEALYLTRFASQVTLIHRRDSLRAAKSIQEKAFALHILEFSEQLIHLTVLPSGFSYKDARNRLSADMTWALPSASCLLSAPSRNTGACRRKR